MADNEKVYEVQQVAGKGSVSVKGEGRYSGSLKLIKKVNDTSLELGITEATLQDPNSLRGASIVASRKYKFVTAGITYELDSHKTKASLAGSNTLSNGHQLNSKATWTEKDNNFNFELGWKPDNVHSITASHDLAKGTSKLGYSWAKNDYTISGTYEPDYQGVLTVKRDLPTYSVKASYAFADDMLTAEWASATSPYTITAKAPLERNGFGIWTATLTASKTFEV